MQQNEILVMKIYSFKECLEYSTVLLQYRQWQSIVSRIDAFKDYFVFSSATLNVFIIIFKYVPGFCQSKIVYAIERLNSEHLLLYTSNAFLFILFFPLPFHFHESSDFRIETKSPGFVFFTAPRWWTVHIFHTTFCWIRWTQQIDLLPWWSESRAYTQHKTTQEIKRTQNIRSLKENVCMAVGVNRIVNTIIE